MLRKWLGIHIWSRFILVLGAAWFLSSDVWVSPSIWLLLVLADIYIEGVHNK